MEPTPRDERIFARWPLAVLLGVLALYALWSVPSLVARWGGSLPGVVLALGWAGLAFLAWPVSRAGAPRGGVAAMLLGLVALRLGAAAVSAARVSPGDPQAYLDLAHHLLAGEGLWMREPDLGIRTFAFYPPGYPLVLAAWGAVFGFSTASLLALSTAIDLVAAWLIARIGARAGAPRAGVAAAWLYLLWPSVVLSAPLAQKESLQTLLVLIVAERWLAAPGRWRTLALGAAAGALALVQPGAAMVPALFGLAVVPRLGWRAVLRAGVGAAAVALVVMLPWWVRNALVLHRFVPLTSAAGASLWIGNNPQATGNWMPAPRDLKGLGELEYGARAGARGWAWIAAHPGDFARLSVTKLLRAGGVGQFGIVRLTAMRPPLPTAIAAALLPVLHGCRIALLGAAALGAVRRVPGVVVLFAAACAAQWIAFGVWFEFGERHTDFALPFLLLLGCAGVSARR